MPMRMSYFTSELKKISPDIACLQETHINNERSVAGEIAAALGGYHTQEVSMSPSHIDRQYALGNAVISKEMPRDAKSQTYVYPTFPLVLPDGKPAVHHDKGFQVINFSFGMVINTQMMPLGFLGTPYRTPLGRSFARDMEKQLLAHVRHPFILCGDLNVSEVTEFYPELLKLMKNVLPDMPTRPRGGKPDYIFLSKEYQVIDAGVIETNTDHYLCWAKISI